MPLPCTLEVTLRPSLESVRSKASIPTAAEPHKTRERAIVFAGLITAPVKMEMNLRKTMEVFGWD